jgi:hypothetical protein
MATLLLQTLTHHAEELAVYTIELRDHLFFPSRLEVPANVKFKLKIINHDDSIEEFDSFDLNREKVIFPNSQAHVYIGPLKKGRYSYFGEYNRNTATGILVAVETQVGRHEKDVN